MEISGLPRGFSTCCLRFTSDVATTPAKLASGRLARLYREGVEPSGSLQKVSDHIYRPPFLDLSWRNGSSMVVPHVLFEDDGRELGLRRPRPRAGVGSPFASSWSTSWRTLVRSIPIRSAATRAGKLADKGP